MIQSDRSSRSAMWAVASFGLFLIFHEPPLVNDQAALIAVCNAYRATNLYLLPAEDWAPGTLTAVPATCFPVACYWVLNAAADWTGDHRRGIYLLDLISAGLLWTSWAATLRLLRSSPTKTTSALEPLSWFIVLIQALHANTPDLFNWGSFTLAAYTAARIGWSHPLWAGLLCGALVGATSAFRFAYYAALPCIPAAAILVAWKRPNHRAKLMRFALVAAAVSGSLFLTARAAQKELTGAGDFLKEHQKGVSGANWQGLLSIAPLGATAFGLERVTSHLTIRRPQFDRSIEVFLQLVSVVVLVGVVLALRNRRNNTVAEPKASDPPTFLMFTLSWAAFFASTTSMLTILTVTMPPQVDWRRIPWVFLNETRYFVALLPFAAVGIDWLLNVSSNRLVKLSLSALVAASALNVAVGETACLLDYKGRRTTRQEFCRTFVETEKVVPGLVRGKPSRLVIWKAKTRQEKEIGYMLGLPTPPVDATPERFVDVLAQGGVVLTLAASAEEAMRSLSGNRQALPLVSLGDQTLFQIDGNPGGGPP